MKTLDKALLILAVVVFLLSVYFAIAKADDGVKKYVASEIQMLRLQNKQKDAQLAQKDFFIAQQNFQAAVKALEDEGERVRTENKWPSAILFDKDKLSFNDFPAVHVVPQKSEVQ